MVAIVVIAASAGGLDPLRRIIAALPMPCLAAVFIVVHIGPHRSVLPRLLNTDSQHPATFAQDGALIEAGHIYVAPPDHHMVLGLHRITLNQGPKVTTPVPPLTRCLFPPPHPTVKASWALF